MTEPLRFGIGLMEAFLIPDAVRRAELLARVEHAGIDYVTAGDHVSFHGGTGFDGIVTSTAVLSANPTLSMELGVFLLGLRHPMLAARSIATLAQLAPGRFTLGVGVAGEDRREVSNSGVDPRTRGRRLDEALGLVRRLLAGETVTHEGEFFALDEALILPSPDPAVPIVIGGRGDAAITRTAQLGDGWVGVFCSTRRFAESVSRIRERADAIGRAPDRFGMTVWVGLDRDADRARARLDAKLEALYHLPGEQFHNVTVAGGPERVAEWLRGYVEAGARSVSVVPAAASVEESIELAGEIAALLRAP